MAFKHMSLMWSAKGVIMGHMGDMAFLFRQKKTYHQVSRAKNSYYHIQMYDK